MSLSNKIKELAEQIALDTEQRVSDLNQQIADLESKRDALRLAPQRLANFPVKLGPDYLCPRCWIESGTRSPLFPIPSEGRNDLMRCRLCHFEILFPD